MVKSPSITVSTFTGKMGSFDAYDQQVKKAQELLKKHNRQQADTTNTNGSQQQQVANHSQGEQQNQATGGLKTRGKRLDEIQNKSKELQNEAEGFLHLTEILKEKKQNSWWYNDN